MVRDALVLLALVLSVPFVILCIGLPLVLFVRFLLWIAAALAGSMDRI